MFLQVVAAAEFGGSDEVRDVAALEAALRRPLVQFAGELLYSTPFSRAAAVTESLVVQAPFASGNVRLALLAAALWLEREGYRLEASPSDLVSMAADAAAGRMELDGLERWLEQWSAPLERLSS